MDRPVALVTGVGKGIGAAISRQLADDGHHVVVNDLDTDLMAAVPEVMVDRDALQHAAADRPGVRACRSSIRTGTAAPPSSSIVSSMAVASAAPPRSRGTL